jgi:hypothetical protein
MMRDTDFRRSDHGLSALAGFAVDTGLYEEVFGTAGCFTTDDRGPIAQYVGLAFAAMLGTSHVAALDLAANYRTMGTPPRGDGAGIPACDIAARFVIENISRRKLKDARPHAQMGIVGDMGRFTQFQTAQAITGTAKAGGGAGDFMGMGPV